MIGLFCAFRFGKTLECGCSWAVLLFGLIFAHRSMIRAGEAFSVAFAGHITVRNKCSLHTCKHFVRAAYQVTFCYFIFIF